VTFVGVVNLVGINGKIYSCICLKTLAFLLKILFFSTLDFCLGYDRFLFWISASCPVFVVASTGGAFISVSIFVPIGMFSVLLFTEKVNPFSHFLLSALSLDSEAHSRFLLLISVRSPICLPWFLFFDCQF
jgi:hypothetical protein